MCTFKVIRFVYISLTDGLSGIFVRSIAEGSAAALDGRIQLNDQIIAVSKSRIIKSMFYF